MDDKKDAKRWRALMRSQRFHIIALTGFTLVHKDGDERNRSKSNLGIIPNEGEALYLKIEFWDRYEGKPFKDAFERDLMETYVDNMIAREEGIAFNGTRGDNSHEIHMRPLPEDPRD